MTDTSTNDGTRGNAARYQPGELVDITIRGAHVVDVSDRSINIQTADDQACLIFRFGTAGIAIERRSPRDWPPQPTDIWADRDGDTWAVVGDLRGKVEMRCTVSGTRGSGWSDPAEVLAAFGPMALLYRPGWTPHIPGDPEPVDERAAMVTAIREFADWLELNTDLPVPYAVDAQGYPETIDEARRLASDYGARIARDDDEVFSAKVGIGDRDNGYPLVNYTLYRTKPQPEVVDEPLVDERGDAEKTQQVEEDAAERRSLEAEWADETQWECGNCGRLAGPDEPHACVPAQRETAE